MPLVVVDTSVSLPATLSPQGMMRRFWVVLALGALTYEVEHGRLELDELARQAEHEGGTVRGLGKARARIEKPTIAGRRCSSCSPTAPPKIGSRSAPSRSSTSTSASSARSARSLIPT